MENLSKLFKTKKKSVFFRNPFLSTVTNFTFTIEKGIKTCNSYNKSEHMKLCWNNFYMWKLRILKLNICYMLSACHAAKKRWKSMKSIPGNTVDTAASGFYTIMSYLFCRERQREDKKILVLQYPSTQIWEYEYYLMWGEHKTIWVAKVDSVQFTAV